MHKLRWGGGKNLASAVPEKENASEVHVNVSSLWMPNGAGEEQAAA